MITLTSGLFPCLDKNRSPQDWLDFAGLLCASGLPTVLYGDPELLAQLDAGAQGAVRSAVKRPLDDDQVRLGLWLHPELQSILEAQGLDPQQALAHMVRLRSVGWLHDESIFNAHGTAAFLWVDPLLLDQVQPAYLAAGGALSRMAPLLEDALILDSGEAEDGAGASAMLFGGSAPALKQINQAYWEAYARLIGQHHAPAWPALAASLWRELPGTLKRYVLQSNGLPGAFFESLLAGPVPLETVHVVG